MRIEKNWEMKKNALMLIYTRNDDGLNQNKMEKLKLYFESIKFLDELDIQLLSRKLSRMTSTFLVVNWEDFVDIY